jgi:exonuclease SbcC
MRLIRLGLKNFRQHAESELQFRPGLTGIIGPNGSGKSTILEAIAWAIYGAPAVRGTRDTLRFNRAPGRSAVRAELEFELRGERLRVVRTPRNAELYRFEQADPIAAGINEVTRQLTRRLGMTHAEFFNTYFTGQKELQFLARMGPIERARFLGQVLGYERLRAAQGLVREERKVLKAQVEALRRTLDDPEEVRKSREAAEERLREATAVVGRAERRHAETAARLAELEPTWNELQRARERDREIHEELRVAETKLKGALKKKEDAEKELEDLAAASDQLRGLKEQVRPLEDLRAEEVDLRGLAEAARRRETLTKQLADQRERVSVLAGKVKEQEEKGRLHDELKVELAKQEEQCAKLEAVREDALSHWQRDIQDVEARLRFLLDQADELKGQIDKLEAEGPDGACPTCKRPLGAEYDRVVELVRGQHEEVIQDGKWHRKRQEQLTSEPDDVAAAKAKLDEARKERERLRAEVAAAEAARSQAAALREELDTEEAEARSMAGELAALPDGYDVERHKAVQEELERLRELEKQVTRIETRLERETQLKRGRAEATEEERQISGQISELESARAELGFSEEEHRAAGEEFESARAEFQAAGLELERARGEQEAAREAADAARREERDHLRMSEQIATRQKEFRLHNHLDSALGELRDDLNNRVRPELSEIASVFITELTDGRYNEIELDQNVDVTVLDDGEEKPVISGGEEDLSNLVLRLAISQLIAERAGQTLNLLIFDEVFGGLDEQRRESVVRLLQRLQERFDQVVLITHIESIREGMDQVLRVTYDESTGASTVREESPGATPEDLVEEDLAALVGE